MVGSIYKIIAKVLALRLRLVLDPLIDEKQTVFVMDRQIVDGVLIANESIVWLKKKKFGGAFLKLDFSKTYDSIRWDFFEHVMEKMRFGKKSVDWIMSCVSTTSISILLNGSPLKPIQMGRGLRQGDPLLSYLFLMVSEALVTMFRRAKNLGYVKTLKIGENGVPLKHLQFADDTLLFVPRDANVVHNYFKLLDVFSIMSGLSRIT